MREWREPSGEIRPIAPEPMKVIEGWPPKWLCYVAGVVNGVAIGMVIGCWLAGGKW